MQPSTFLETLRREVALLQVQYPDRADEVSRACALITMGAVVDQGDGNGKVLSSDGKRYYSVNGQCECSAAQHGKHCKHLSAWKLYRHVERLMTTQATPEAEVVQTTDSFPEARASLNFKALIGGFEVQLTLRDDTEEAILKRLQVLLKRSDIRPVPPRPAARSGNWKKPYQGR
jgi:hypothetical protein